MRSAARRLRLIFGALIALACHGAEPSQRSPTLLLVQVRAFGGDTDSILTAPIWDIEQLDAALFVAMPREGTVAKYDTTGRFLGRLARRGGGPGEFEFPARIGVRGDSLWVVDGALRRTQFFSASGTLHGAIRSEGWGALLPMAGGRWFVDEAFPYDGKPRTLRTQDSLGNTSSLATMVPAPRPASFTDANGMKGELSPVGESAWWQVSPDGEFIVIAEHMEPESRELVIRRIPATGEEQWRSRIPFEPFLVSQVWYDSLLSDRLRVISRERSVDMETLRRALPRPVQLPVARGIIVSDRGEVWIQRVVPPGDSSRFLRLSQQGEWLGTATALPGFRAMRIRGDCVLGYRVLESGSHVVQLLSISR